MTVARRKIKSGPAVNEQHDWNYPFGIKVTPFTDYESIEKRLDPFSKKLSFSLREGRGYDVCRTASFPLGLHVRAYNPENKPQSALVIFEDETMYSGEFQTVRYYPDGARSEMSSRKHKWPIADGNEFVVGGFDTEVVELTSDGGHAITKTNVHNPNSPLGPYFHVRSVNEKLYITKLSKLPLGLSFGQDGNREIVDGLSDTVWTHPVYAPKLIL